MKFLPSKKLSHADGQSNLIPKFGEQLKDRVIVVKKTELKYIGIMVRVFANGPEDLGSIPGWVIPKTLKIVLDAILLYTQHYKLRIKGKVEQPRERSSTLPYILV